MSGVPTFEQDVLGALRTLLATVPGLPTKTNTQFENRKYEPVVETPWVREMPLATTDRKAVTLGPTPLIRTEGTYDLELNLPAGTGTVNGYTVVGQLLATFTPRTDVLHNGLVVHISGARKRWTRQAADWYRTAVVIEWWADTFNPV